MLLEAMSPPTLVINESVSKISTDISFHLMNPFNEEFEAVKMAFTVIGEVEFELLEGYILIGNIKNAQFKVTELQTYF